MFMRGLFPHCVFHEGLPVRCLSPTPCFTAASLCVQQAPLPQGACGSEASLFEGCSARPGIHSPCLGGGPWGLMIALPESEKGVNTSGKCCGSVGSFWCSHRGGAMFPSPGPLCQLRAPEIFPLADCGNASKLLSAWIISEMLGNFLMPALLSVIVMLSLASEINIIVGYLFVFISKVSGSISSLGHSPAVSTWCSSGTAGLRP